MSEWPSQPLGELAAVTMGQSPDSAAVNGTEAGLPFLQGCAEFGERFPTPRLHCSPPLRVAKAGSTLISVRAPVGTTNRADQDYCIGRGLGAVSAKPGVADDIFLLHAIEANLEFLHRRSQGSTFLAISSKDLYSLPVPAPRLPTQRRIAEILSTLDEAIEQTEALIAKMQQVKAGLMHDLFTRGVTPDGRLRPTREQAPELYKESPLGWIPKGWEVDRLSRLAQFITSGSRGWAEYYSDNGPLFIRIGNLTREHINFRWDNVVRVSLPKFTEGQRTAVVPNDILISITADLGIVAVANESLDEAYVNQHIALVRPNCSACVSKFIGHYLTTSEVQKQFLRLNDSGAKAGLNLPAVGRLLVARPRYETEAKQIVESLDSCDRDRQALKHELAQLLNLKHGLMDDLLSGNVQVSGTPSDRSGRSD